MTYMHLNINGGNQLIVWGWKHVRVVHQERSVGVDHKRGHTLWMGVDGVGSIFQKGQAVVWYRTIPLCPWSVDTDNNF